MHKIVYKNAYSSWDEALPLGNGHFGTMVFNKKNELVYTINHYDVYYRKLWLYSNKFKEESKIERPTDTTRYLEIQERAIKAHEDPEDMAHYSYNYAIDPDLKQSYGVRRTGIAQPVAAELKIILDESVLGANAFESSLEIENALYRYHAAIPTGDISISTIVNWDSDIILTEINQTGGNKILGLDINIPERQYMERVTEYHTLDENTVYFTDSFYPGDEDKEKFEPFKYIFMLKCNGAKCSSVADSKGNHIKILNSEDKFNILMCVVTEEETKDLLVTAIKRLDEACGDLEGVKKSHQNYWEEFWSKSNISLPDKMLEKLWYLNIYTLECCSGKGARLYEQACGLNGLWDIKQPTQWGSLWYWDVNIEQSFWPVYTGNHMEIAESFNNGLLSYVELARKRAKECYGFRGIAPDYPFEFFNGIWPWCAQHLWWYYQYSGNVEFLRDKAYPIFRDLLLFFEDHLKYDKGKDVYYTFPDISPEQGPVSANATISVACLKYLLKFTLQANRLLSENEEDLQRWENIYNKLSYYAIGESNEFGKIIKDAEWAPTTQYLAHSGLLMPIYPIGEISKRSDDDLKELARNTLKYAENYQTIGTHNFGWLACTSARLGSGDDTLRMLYEKGIAFMLRPNGLFAEETDRWIQNCLTACPPVYNPPLIESGSSLVAAVNEMLLQSFDGLMEVFPALPKGLKRTNESRSRYTGANVYKPAFVEEWKDCSFSRLLAEGAFEVSVRRKDGRTCWLVIKSLAGNEARLVDPFDGRGFSIVCKGKVVSYLMNDGAITFITQKNEIYELTTIDSSVVELCMDGVVNSHSCEETQKPEVYIAPTMRRVFLGKDENTEFLQKLDNMTFDYYQGDVRTSRVSVYRFDFCQQKNDFEKDYESILPVQYHACGKQGLDFVVTGGDIFSTLKGFGWETAKDLEYIDRGMPDAFRRDFFCGGEENKFIIELPKGQYQVFIGTGDPMGEIYTKIDINGQQNWCPEGVIKAGRYKAVLLPIVQWEDGLTEIRFSSVEGYKWNISMMIVNRLL